MKITTLSASNSGLRMRGASPPCRYTISSYGDFGIGNRKFFTYLFLPFQLYDTSRKRACLFLIKHAFWVMHFYFLSLFLPFFPLAFLIFLSVSQCSFFLCSLFVSYFLSCLSYVLFLPILLSVCFFCHPYFLFSSTLCLFIYFV